MLGEKKLILEVSRKEYFGVWDSIIKVYVNHLLLFRILGLKKLEYFFFFFLVKKDELIFTVLVKQPQIKFA